MDNSTIIKVEVVVKEEPNQRSLGDEEPSNITLQNTSDDMDLQTTNTNTQYNTDNAHENRFACKFCTKTFTRAGSRRLHERTHNGEKPFSCKVCQKQFTRNDCRNIHERTHVEPQLFTCQFCNKYFIQSSHCRNHEKTHTRVIEDNDDWVEHVKVTTLETNCEETAIVIVKEENLSVDCNDDDFYVKPENDRMEQQHSITDEPNECMTLTNRPVTSKSNVFARQPRDTSSVTSKPQTTTHTKIKAQRQREYRQRIAASRTPEEMMIARKLNAERQRNCRIRKAANVSYSCGVCKQTFSQKSRWKRHETTHTEDKSHACNICNKVLNENHRCEFYGIKRTGEQRVSYGKRSRGIGDMDDGKEFKCGVNNGEAEGLGNNSIQLKDDETRTVVKEEDDAMDYNDDFYDLYKKPKIEPGNLEDNEMFAQF